MGEQLYNVTVYIKTEHAWTPLVFEGVVIDASELNMMTRSGFIMLSIGGKYTMIPWHSIAYYECEKAET